MNGRTLDNSLDEEFQVFMDLVSHDILNINQAILSAIELMTESSGADEKAKRHVRRAEAQIRISTQIFESMKMLCLMRKAGEAPSSELVDLNEAVRKAVSDASDIFPDRRVRVDLEESGEKAVVAGGPLVRETLTNALMGMIRLDTSEQASMRVRVSGEDVHGAGHWVVLLSDENVTAPSTMEFETIGEVSEEARTRMGGMAGLIMARMMAEKLGGTFETEPTTKGSEFRVKFAGAEGE